MMMSNRRMTLANLTSFRNQLHSHFVAMKLISLIFKESLLELYPQKAQKKVAST